MPHGSSTTEGAKCLVMLDRSIACFLSGNNLNKELNKQTCSKSEGEATHQSPTVADRQATQDAANCMSRKYELRDGCPPHRVSADFLD